MNLDQATELKHSSLWTALVGEIDKMVNFELSKIRTCTPDELGVIQARISCYEALTRLPADVIEREAEVE